MKTHLIVMAGGKNRDTVMSHLPFYLRHLGDEGVLEFAAPIDDSIVIHPHQTYWCSTPMSRLRTAIDRLANKADLFDAHWLFDYDSLCLRRELPAVGENEVAATWFIEPDRAYSSQSYARGPIGFGTQAVQIMASKFKLFNDEIEHGRVDRAIGLLVKSADCQACKMKQHVYAYAQEKIERHHHAEMAEKIRCGAYLLKGVRDAATLATALDSNEHQIERLRTVDTSLRNCTGVAGWNMELAR